MPALSGTRDTPSRSRCSLPASRMKEPKAPNWLTVSNGWAKRLTPQKPKTKVTLMNNGIAGKVVVITGASSGLGEATARLLSAEGATVVLGARRADRIQSLAQELIDRGGKALAVETDVTRADEVKRLGDAAVQKYGRIDVMINNAGLMPYSPLERLKIDDWGRMIDVNIKGVLYGIAALPHMKQKKAGHIINVSSVAGHKVTPGGVVYARPSMPCARCLKDCARK